MGWWVEKCIHVSLASYVLKKKYFISATHSIVTKKNRFSYRCGVYDGIHGVCIYIYRCYMQWVENETRKGLTAPSGVVKGALR